MVGNADSLEVDALHELKGNIMATLGIHTFALAPNWDIGLLRNQADRLKLNGVRMLEIPLLRPQEMDVAAARAFAEEFEFELITSLGLPANLDIVRDPESGLEFFEIVFKVSKALGCQAVSGVTYGTIGKTSGQPITQIEKDGVCRFIQSAATKAKQHGLKFGIEPCNRYETHLMNTAEHAVDFINAVGAENLFIHLDTYHMNIEEVSFKTAFATAGQHLGYVHLSESNRGVPGEGMVNWQAAMEALAMINYDGPLALESMNYVDRDIANGLAVWRPVASNPEDVINIGLPFLRKMAANAGLQL